MAAAISQDPSFLDRPHPEEKRDTLVRRRPKRISNAETEEKRISTFLMEYLSRSEKDTIAFAKKFARTLKPGSVIALEGDLGSGKTTFIKGLALGLGLKDPDEVKSPTFAIMHIYPTTPKLYHFDLYRFENSKEAEAIGFEEFINDPSVISCIEWPGRAGKLIPKASLRISLEAAGGDLRKITLP